MILTSVQGKKRSKQRLLVEQNVEWKSVLKDDFLSLPACVFTVMFVLMPVGSVSVTIRDIGDSSEVMVDFYHVTGLQEGPVIDAV